MDEVISDIKKEEDLSKKYQRQKISRNKIFLIIKKIYIYLIIALTMLITTILGIWNIKKIEISNTSNITYTQEEKILKSASISKGKNFFKVKPIEIQEKIIKENKFVSTAHVSKIFPNKIEIYIEEYEPYILANLSDSNCYLISQEGLELERICEGCREECPQNMEQWKVYYLYSEDIGMTLNNGKKKLLITEDLKNINTIINEFGYTIKSYNIANSVVEILLENDSKIVFDLSSDLEIQLSRFALIAKRIVEDQLNFSSLDVRFERPVLKN